MKLFLDSSVLIEYIKGNQTELLDKVIQPELRFELCINHIVFSEFMFHYLSLISNKSPLTLKNSSAIQSLLKQHNPIEFLQNFTVLPMNGIIMQTAYHFMECYNFLPNDALILSTCKHNKIQYLLSFDNDFEKACEKESIHLTNHFSDAEKIISF
jgi:predicted nucleic acid-binding protein